MKIIKRTDDEEGVLYFWGWHMGDMVFTDIPEAAYIFDDQTILENALEDARQRKYEVSVLELP